MVGVDPPAAALVANAEVTDAIQTLYALVYIAWEGVAMGKLARDDAPDLVMSTLVRGLGVAA